MPHPVGKKEESRARILESAGRGFRSQGFGGLGVDGLAKEAGVTSGAFYAHFKSKAEAFRKAIAVGLDDLRIAIEHFRQAEGSSWRERFVAFYLGDRRTCDLAQSCALQSLSADVARSDGETRKVYEAEFRRVLDAAASGLKGSAGRRRADAIALLALLAGGVSIARAVENSELGDEIADAVRDAADRLMR
jgi:TetR/AcrR family transcriptional regulator, transcriptional repressor for nem operon